MQQLKIFLSLVFTMVALLAEGTECPPNSTPVEKHLEAIGLQHEGLKTVLQEATNFRQPLEVLFPFELASEEEIENTKNVLSGLQTKKAVQKSKEFKEFLRCAPKDFDSEAFAGLISEKNILLLRFLELPPKRRAVLVDTYIATKSKKVSTKDLDEEIEKYQNQLEITKNDTTEGMVVPAEDSTPILETIIDGKKALETYRLEIAANQLNFLEKIKARENALSDLQKELYDTIKRSDSEMLPAVLERSVKLWESSVEKVRELFTDLAFSTSFSLPLKIQLPVNASDLEQSEHQSYLEARKKTQLEGSDIFRSRTKRLNSLKARGFRLLTEAGKLRASLLEKCDSNNSCLGHRKLNSKNLTSMYLEVSVIPIKIRSWAIAKVLEVRGKVSAGFDGWVDLGYQIFILFLLLVLPAVFYRSLIWFTGKLDDVRKELLAKSMLDFRKRTAYATWISRTIPFIPAAGLVLMLWGLRNVVGDTSFSELSDVLYYFQLYFLYRLFRLMTKILLSVVFTTDSILRMKDRKLLAESTSRRVSRIIFFEYAFLHLVENSVRKALVYGLLSGFVLSFNILLLFWEANRWREPLLESVRSRFPKFPLSLLERNRFASFLAGPFLLVLVGTFDLMVFGYRHLIRFDFFKKLNSEVLRRRLQDDVPELERALPPAEYMQYFDYYLPATDEIQVDLDDGVFKIAIKMVSDWKLGATSDDLLVIVGNRGMGKTTALKRIGSALSIDEIINVSPKMLRKKDLFGWLCEITGTRIDSLEDFLGYDQKLVEKKVFIIDDIQNFFLGTIDGFSAYRSFVEILGLRTRNVFWCLTVNSRSWAYLKGVFGAEHFYGKVIPLSPWKEIEIQNLILSRHGRTGYARKFDPSIKAYGAGADVLGQQTETQFFRLLWGQARGNPRSALMYWISAITQQGSQNVLVGVPSFVNSSAVSTLSDDAHFILAALARHDSLTFDEMMQATSVSAPVIRKCLKEAQDRQLIWCDEALRFRISSRAQYVIDYFLIGKNFLYE